MSKITDSVGWYTTNDLPIQDQGGFSRSMNIDSQHWVEETADDVGADRFPGIEIGPSGFASEIDGNEGLSIATLNIEFDNDFPGHHSPWSQSQLLPNLSFQSPDAILSSGSEYNFAIQKLVGNQDQIPGMDIAEDLQLSDTENDLTVGAGPNPRNVIAQSGGYLPINPGHEYRPAPSHSAFTCKNPVNRGDAPERFRRGLSPSAPAFNSPLRRNPYRSVQRPNISTKRPHAQPKCHPCDRCPSAFGRAGDLRRHYRVHFPDRHTFHCHLEGCHRNGQRGFYRRDKFRDHQRQAHGAATESGLVLLEGAWSSMNRRSS